MSTILLLLIYVKVIGFITYNNKQQAGWIHCSCGLSSINLCNIRIFIYISTIVYRLRSCVLKQHFIINSGQTCLELIWDFWSFASGISNWLWSLRYYKTNRLVTIADFPSVPLLAAATHWAELKALNLNFWVSSVI